MLDLFTISIILGLHELEWPLLSECKLNTRLAHRECELSCSLNSILDNSLCICTRQAVKMLL
jgi:hypothetical protein